MKQVFTVHGGDAFATYEDYINYLRTREIRLQRLNSWDWKSRLPESLGPEYQVLSPQMPNKQNSKYDEWKLWFERFFPYLEDEVVLIGHSLGGCFIAKYLAENQFPKKIAATMLVAAPYDEAENPEFAKHLAGFAVPKNIQNLEAQGGHIFLYQSKDDPVVSFSEFTKFQNALPKATPRVFEDRGHFNQDSFPELVSDIKAL